MRKFWTVLLALLCFTCRAQLVSVPRVYGPLQLNESEDWYNETELAWGGETCPVNGPRLPVETTKYSILPLKDKGNLEENSSERPAECPCQRDDTLWQKEFLLTWEEKLSAWEEALFTKKEDIMQREKDLKLRDEVLSARKDALNLWEDALLTRENDLSKSEQDILWQEQGILMKHMDLRKKEKALSAGQQNLNIREEALMAKEQATKLSENTCTLLDKESGSQSLQSLYDTMDQLRWLQKVLCTAGKCREQVQLVNLMSSKELESPQTWNLSQQTGPSSTPQMKKKQPGPHNQHPTLTQQVVNTNCAADFHRFLVDNLRVTDEQCPVEKETCPLPSLVQEPGQCSLFTQERAENLSSPNMHSVMQMEETTPKVTKTVPEALPVRSKISTHQLSEQQTLIKYNINRSKSDKTKINRIKDPELHLNKMTPSISQFETSSQLSKYDTYQSTINKNRPTTYANADASLGEINNLRTKPRHTETTESQVIEVRMHSHQPKITQRKLNPTEPQTRTKLTSEQKKHMKMQIKQWPKKTKLNKNKNLEQPLKKTGPYMNEYWPNRSHSADEINLMYPTPQPDPKTIKLTKSKKTSDVPTSHKKITKVPVNRKKVMETKSKVQTKSDFYEI